MLTANHFLPFYEQTKQWLRKQIADGVFKPARALPPEAQLAGAMGVSPMTMRRALIELTREGLLQRVRGKGTFVRSSFAPKGRVHRIGVGLVIPFSKSNPGCAFYQKLVYALHIACEDNGVFLALRQAMEPHESFVCSLEADKSLRALIVMDVGDQKLLRLFQDMSKPVVLLDNVQPQQGPQFDEINCLGEQGMLQAVNSLIELGHRDIGFIQSLQSNAIMDQRQHGYEKALRLHGIAVREDFLFKVPVCHDGGYRCMQAIMASKNIPTAIACVSDDVAVGVMTAALEAGLKLPRDLSVVGFGDLGEFTSPALSTVRIPLELLGNATMQAVRERLLHPTLPLKRTLFQADFLPRASCTCPRQFPIA
jgi:DNA-binding LacI/PurR family transcriptional regulator